jgi:hypothetical protein
LDVTPLLQLAQVRQQKKRDEAQTEQDVARTAAVQQQARIAATKEQERQSEELAWKFGVQNVFVDPSTESFTKLMAQFPNRITEIKTLSEAQSGAQRTRNVQAAMTLGGLVNSGMNDRAVAFLQERRGALVEGGESTEVTDDLIDALKKGETARVKALSGMVIIGTLGEGAPDVLETLGWGPKAQEKAADNARADRAQAETERHNRKVEGQGDARVGLSREAGARAGRKGSGGGAKTKLPSGFILD